MVHVSCYNCGSDRSAFYAAENGFTMVKCEGCGLLYVSPRPTDHEIAQAQQLGMHAGDALLDTTGEFNAAKVRGYLAVLADLYPAGLRESRCTWLDIGCGHGEFLVALSQYSDRMVDAAGLEPNARKRDAARARGLDVGYFDIGACRDRYDYVSLLNVYSHLPDPPGFLSSCRKLLRPGGELLLETGDAAHLSAEEMYRPMFLPDHLSFASETIVRSILDRCGFQVTAVCKYPFIPFTVIRATQELIKQMLPKRQSLLRYLLSRRYRTDMYIRARVR